MNPDAAPSRDWTGASCTSAGRLRPAVLDDVQNVAGLTPAQAAAEGVSGTVATNGQVGNLQLTASQATDLVNFLKNLTDGYGPITPVSYP